MADKPEKTAKRRVKNPETFRERAEKAAQEGEKTSKTGGIKPALGSILGTISKPIKWFFRQLGRFRLFRLIGRIVYPEYFRSSWQELKLVHWPSRKQSRQLTFAVLVFAFVFGVTIAIVDYGLDKLFRNILLK